MADNPTYLEQVKMEHRQFLKEKGFSNINELVEAYAEASQRINITKNTSPKDAEKVLKDNGFYPKNADFYKTLHSVDKEVELKERAYNMGLTQSQYEKLVDNDVAMRQTQTDRYTKLQDHFKPSDDDLTAVKDKLSKALESAPEEIQAGLRNTIEDKNTLLAVLASQKADADLEKVPKTEEAWDNIDAGKPIPDGEAPKQLDTLNAHHMVGVLGLD